MEYNKLYEPLDTQHKTTVDTTLPLDQHNIKHNIVEDPSTSPLKKHPRKEYTGTTAKYTSQLENKQKRPEVYKESFKAIEEYHVLGKGEEDMLACRLDYDDSLLACALSNGTVDIYNISGGKLLHSLSSASESGMPATALRWRPPLPNVTARAVLVTGCADGTVTHWHVSSGKMMDRFVEAGNQILAMDFNKEGNLLATAGKDFKIRIYDEATKENTITLERGIWNFPGHSNRVFSVKFVEEDPNIIVSGGWDNNLHIWDLRDKKSIACIYGPAISGDSLDYKNGIILTGSWRNTDQLQLWDFGTRKLMRTIDWDYDIKRDSAYIYSAQFSKDSDRYIVAGTSNLNEVKVFDKQADYHDFGKIKLEKGCYSVDFAYGKPMFAFCGGDGEAHLVKITDKKSQ